ncbi:multidrug DMT transporter permease [Bombiscardovia apis]|uniref:Multidrug DMT transporter permease n=1 Tax=Bombiscardovia apis TaxID=2932182 RepID=A0ABM8BC61_9BIFI|nr:ABC transporter permease [Bombiscardovia apis]BDR54498.1 multidrug DMT transporter permease [Bombiscardovia apis]
MNTAIITKRTPSIERRQCKAALWADALRAVGRGWKRFLSIFIICALGVTMFLGLTSLADDVAESADSYFKRQGLYDLSVTAARGLNQSDIDHLSRVRGVGNIAGVVAQDFNAKLAGSRKRLSISTLNSQGINQPFRVAGVMPHDDSQIAVNELYLKDSGKHLGDSVKLSELITQPSDGQSPMLFKDKSYTIVAQVNDAKNMYNPDFATGSTSTQADYSFFVQPSACIREGAYSSAYLTLAHASDVLAYGQDYKSLVSETKAAIGQTKPSQGSEAKSSHASSSSSNEQTRWIVRDRSLLQSYNQIDTQVSFLKLFGITFPLLFLLVAVLISLTSIRRMVEEDRQLLGTYKALGYTKREILLKYLAFAGLSSLLGSAIGALLGSFALPSLAFPLLKNMYLIPSYSLKVNWILIVIGLGIFIASIVGTAWYTCMGELKVGPAALMRPQSPKGGTSIALQKVGFIWGRMSFLNKVTARNLFRYKSRAFMSIFGVFGCTALMMVSFTLRDTMLSLPDQQYGQVYSYDAIAVTSPEHEEQAARELADNPDVKEFKPVFVQAMNVSAERSTNNQHKGSEGNASARNGVEQVALQLIVLPDGQSLEGYIRLQNAQTKAQLKLPDSGGVLTVNAAKLLGLGPDTRAWAEDSARFGHGLTVAAITENYTGNSLYMSESAYTAAFQAEHFAPNAMLLKLKGNAQAKIAAANALEQDEHYLSVVSNQQLREDFASNYATVNDVVGLLIVMAALLCFVVLFTLSTTNISERERELATIKVLGFRRGEVHSYVNKETLVLTLFGIALGLPAGWALTYPMVGMMKMPGIHLEVRTSLLSWISVAVLALAFALAVMLITNRSLDRIDMVESLKSPE